MNYREKRIHGETGLPVSVYCVDPNDLRYYMNCHWHKEHEIIYVRSGVFKLRLGAEEEWCMTAGDVAFIQGGTLHSGTPVDCSYVCILFDPMQMLSGEDACKEMIEDIAGGRLRVTERLSAGSPAFLPLCQTLTDVMEEREAGFAFFAKGLIWQIMGILCREKLCHKQQTDGAGDEKQAGKMKNVLAYIHRHYNQEITLERLAELAGMNPNYFCRSFRRITGQTPIEYLIAYRLESAAYSLRNSDLTVTDVAFGCGFNDVSHFIKMFRKTYGTTPKLYRDGRRDEG